MPLTLPFLFGIRPSALQTAVYSMASSCRPCFIFLNSKRSVYFYASLNGRSHHDGKSKQIRLNEHTTLFWKVQCYVSNYCPYISQFSSYIVELCFSYRQAPPPARVGVGFSEQFMNDSPFVCTLIACMNMDSNIATNILPSKQNRFYREFALKILWFSHVGDGQTAVQAFPPRR